MSNHDKPCPNCGHCPTCGHSPRQFGGPIWIDPRYWQPNPWWQQPVTITCGDSTSVSPADIAHQTSYTTGALA